MNVVIPMAGRGERFRQAGHTTPKPLIEVRGRPMYAWAAESLPLELASRLVFICLDEHLRGGFLEADVRRRYGHLPLEILALGEVTRGQAETVLRAREIIDDATPLLVFNADTFVRSPRLRDRLGEIEGCDGLVGVFRAKGDHWSFARLDEDGFVLEMAEKRRISPWASTGLYVFTRGRDFVRLAEGAIQRDERVRGEFYVAPLYNALIAEGGRVAVDVAEEVWPLGTPAELRYFLEHGPATT